ncbi:DUF4097 family beta strand repeat-containing protein [Clostridioides sp. ZZV15-6598]|uniref:DUF4097 family beta strand repeat-containing protein n=1 Tax=Clostridioides sp. ZZV15-6598 TaxID=2811501 RepID=UPI001D10CE3D|nr:hypothetical protein [Clostridioides sp. ZZV15-6598]
MKNFFWKITLLATICVGMAGCSDKTKNTDTAQVGEIDNIIIKTSGNDIVIQKTSGNNVTASIVGYDGDLIVQKENTLLIDIPTPKGGVKLSSPKTLYIGIPDSNVVSLSATSDTGKVKIESVNVNKISVSTQIGNITTSELAGSVKAKTDLGKIQSSLKLSNDINDSGDGSSYDGIIGDKTESIINLYSSMGDIEMK